MNVIVLNQILKVPDACQGCGTFYRHACLCFMILTANKVEFNLNEIYPEKFPNGDQGTYGDVLSMLPFFIEQVYGNSKCVLVKADYSYGVLLHSTQDVSDDVAFRYLNLQHNKISNIGIELGESKRKREETEETERDKKKTKTQTVNSVTVLFGRHLQATFNSADPYEEVESTLKNFGDGNSYFLNDSNMMVALTEETYPSLFTLNRNPVVIFKN